MSLLVVGSIAFDTIKTPHGELEDALGGAAVYFSLAAGLFTDVRLVGVVGGDFREEHVDFLRRRRVDVSGLERLPAGRTFRWTGQYSADMNHRTTLAVELNVLEDFRPKIPAEFRDSRFVFLANGSPVTQLSVLDQVPRPLFVMADTMDLWIETQRRALDCLLPRVHGLLLNDSEALLLTGEGSVIRAGRAIQRMGPGRVVVKKGEHGAILFDGPEILPLPALPVEDVRDPTGAGDSFAGALMGYLASPRGGGQEGGAEMPPDGRALKTALAYGAVVASFTVEDFGVNGIAKATRAAVERRFETYREGLAL